MNDFALDAINKKLDIILKRLDGQTHAINSLTKELENVKDSVEKQGKMFIDIVKVAIEVDNPPDNNITIEPVTNNNDMSVLYEVKGKNIPFPKWKVQVDELTGEKLLLLKFGEEEYPIEVPDDTIRLNIEYYDEDTIYVNFIIGDNKLEVFTNWE